MHCESAPASPNIASRAGPPPRPLKVFSAHRSSCPATQRFLHFARATLLACADLHFVPVATNVHLLVWQRCRFFLSTLHTCCAAFKRLQRKSARMEPFPHQAIKSFISVKCDINEVEKRTSTKIVISLISNRCILLLRKHTCAFTFSLPLAGKLTLPLNCLFSVCANIHCLFRLPVVHLCPGSLSLHL